jgi:hypothetical protein
VYKTAWQTSQYFAFGLTGAAQGVWQVDVLAKDVFSAATYQTWAITSFAVGIDYCRAVNVNVSPSSPTSVGTGVQVDGIAVGCPLPTYAIFMLSPGSKTWVMVLPYGAIGASAYNWVTTGLAKGGYRFSVWAREQLSPNKYDTYAMVTVWLT